MIVCPSCKKPVKDGETVCPNPKCREDLSSIAVLREIPLAHYNKGLKHAKEKQWDLAIENFMVSITLDPKMVNSYVVLGKIYAQREIYDEAIKYWDKALQIDPGNEDVKNARAKAETLQARLYKTHLPPFFKKPAGILTFIIIPVVTFVIGLKLGTFTSPSPPSPLPISSSENIRLVAKESAIDYPALSKKLKRSVSNHPDLTNLDVEVTHNNKNLIISGMVPGDLHRSLIIAMAKNVAGNTPIDSLNLFLIPPPAEPEKEEEITPITYTVDHGDTLSYIASKFYGDRRKWRRIYEVNMDKITDPDRIVVGQVLSIPLDNTNMP